MEQANYTIQSLKDTKTTVSLFFLIQLLQCPMYFKVQSVYYAYAAYLFKDVVIQKLVFILL